VFDVAVYQGRVKREISARAPTGGIQRASESKGMRKAAGAWSGGVSPPDEAKPRPSAETCENLAPWRAMCGNGINELVPLPKPRSFAEISLLCRNLVPLPQPRSFAKASEWHRRSRGSRPAAGRRRSVRKRSGAGDGIGGAVGDRRGTSPLLVSAVWRVWGGVWGGVVCVGGGRDDFEARHALSPRFCFCLLAMPLPSCWRPVE
jgi:hypothetical protein